MPDPTDPIDDITLGPCEMPDCPHDGTATHGPYNTVLCYHHWADALDIPPELRQENT